MKRISQSGLALVVVCALGAAFATSAMAHSFSATAMSSVKASADATNVFTTAAGKVECTKLSVTSGSTVLNALTLTATVQYTGCTAFGLSATISPAQYEFNADGTATILKEITIKATLCEVKVPTAGNSGLKTIAYKQNGASAVLVEPNVTGITSSGTGTACKYASENKGTYTGNSHVTAASGNVTWK